MKWSSVIREESPAAGSCNAIAKEVERDTTEAIAAWLELKSKDYKRKQNEAFADGNVDSEGEYGWAWSYTDAHASDIRAGRYRPTTKGSGDE